MTVTSMLTYSEGTEKSAIDSSDFYNIKDLLMIERNQETRVLSLFGSPPRETSILGKQLRNVWTSPFCLYEVSTLDQIGDPKPLLEGKLCGSPMSLHCFSHILPNPKMRKCLCVIQVQSADEHTLSLNRRPLPSIWVRTFNAGAHKHRGITICCMVFILSLNRHLFTFPNPVVPNVREQD